MPLLAPWLVVASGLLHALWNLWAKRSQSPLLFLWGLQWVAIAVYGPFAWWSLAARRVPLEGWLWLALTSLLHGIYVLLLARSYRLADLSQVYPLMRGTSPLLVPLLGVSLLGERLPAAGWAGVALVVLGVLVVGGWLPWKGGFRLAGRNGAYAGIAVGVSIACYTLVDKVTLQYVPAVALNAASNLANLLALTLPAMRSGKVGDVFRDAWLTFAGGILSPLSYLLFLWALTAGPVAAFAPMRALGIVFGTALGVFVLRERAGAERIAGACLIAAGAIALGWSS